MRVGFLSGEAQRGRDRWRTRGSASRGVADQDPFGLSTEHDASACSSRRVVGETLALVAGEIPGRGKSHCLRLPQFYLLGAGDELGWFETAA